MFTLPVRFRFLVLRAANRRLAGLLLGLGGLLAGRPAAAQRCLAGFALQGSAVAADTACYRLTAAGVGNSAGAMWSEQPISLAQPFDFRFDISQCGAADGVVFVLQNAGPAAATGDTGGSLGYYGGNGVFAHSLGVELDVYQNAAAPYNDPPGPHLMLALNGNPSAVQGPVNVFSQGGCSRHTLRLVWNPAAPLLTVLLDGNPQFRYARNLVSEVFGGSATVWFGFVGSTGGSTATQLVCPGPIAATVAPPRIVAGGPAVLCPGERLALSVSSQPAGTTFEWSPAAGLSAGSGAAVVAAPAVTTTYRVRITTPNGCQGTDSIQVAVLPRPELAVSTRQTICPGASAALRVSSAEAGLSYRWSPATGLNTATGPAVLATPAVTTRYTVSSTGPGFCTRHDTVTVVVRPLLRLTATAELPTTPGASAVLTAHSPVPGLAYAWLPTAGLSAATGPSVTAAPAAPTTYTVTATDAGGCTAQASVLARPFLLPNVITPNGDGLNDTFRPLVSLAPVMLQIFSRWGRLVFEQANYSDGWSAAGLPAGVYFYRLSTASGQSWKGWVEVLR